MRDMAGGIGGLVTVLGHLGAKNTPPPTTPGGQAGANPGSKSLSAAQFGKVANTASAATRRSVGDGDGNGLPSLSDPSYTPPDDIPNGLYTP